MLSIIQPKVRILRVDGGGVIPPVAILGRLKLFGIINQARSLVLKSNGKSIPGSITIPHIMTQKLIQLLSERSVGTRKEKDGQITTT